MRVLTAVIGITAAFALSGPHLARAAQYRIIWDPSAHRASAFGNIYDVLAADRAGDLYGEGAGGRLFALEPKAGPGPWKGKVIFAFGNPNSGIGVDPYGGLTVAHDTLFGTTFGSTSGCGTAFRLDNPAALTIFDLHVFEGLGVTPSDGCFPASGLTFGLHGLLYGTSNQGGDERQAGAVFAVSPSETNPHYAVIHRFGRPGDGVSPQRGRLAVDAMGRLYGTTAGGGANREGAVFMLENTGGVWKEQVLYSFRSSNDLNRPLADVVLDAQGNVYGCAQGGPDANGGLFQLAPPAQPGAPWTYTVIHNFSPMRGAPIATNGFYGCGITIDPATNRLFGTSYLGGQYGYGTIFELDPPAAQPNWTLKVIHAFDGSDQDGRNPVAPPLKVGDNYFGGNVYGTIYEFHP